METRFPAIVTVVVCQLSRLVGNLVRLDDACMELVRTMQITLNNLAARS